MSAPALFSSPDRPQTITRPILVLAAFVAAFLLLLALNDHPAYLLVAIAIAATPGVCYGIVCLSRRREWLIFPIALVCLLIDISLLDDRMRTGFHYAALALFCIPVFPRVWRSGILRENGFKLYIVFFAWAFVTISYSLAPLYSFARLSEAVMVMLALCACVLEVRQPADVARLLLRFLLACGVMLAMVAVASAVLPHSITWASPLASYTPDELAHMSKAGISVAGLNRFRGLLNNPNDVGMLMLVVVGSALVCWRATVGRQRLILAAMIAAAVGFDVLADSRSAFVATALGGGLFVIWKWRLRGALLCAGGLAVAAAVMLHAGLFEYVGRGNVETLTGRTDMWSFVVQQIRDRPVFGYGYEVSGAIFDSPYFPLWWGPWDLGPHSSLHNGYLGHAIGVGVPAALLWLYIILRPWVFVFRRREDPWNLKPMFFLIVIPILTNNLSEQLLGDFGGGIASLLFGLTWVIAERYRMVASRTMKAEREAIRAAMPKAVGVLASASA